jgi:hypothetical protein
MRFALRTIIQAEYPLHDIRKVGGDMHRPDAPTIGTAPILVMRQGDAEGIAKS